MHQAAPAHGDAETSHGAECTCLKHRAPSGPGSTEGLGSAGWATVGLKPPRQGWDGSGERWQELLLLVLEPGEDNSPQILPREEGRSPTQAAAEAEGSVARP